jgi:cell wall-associated NlpC family hydrolase
LQTAQAIVSAAYEVGLSETDAKKAAQIAITVAITESTLGAGMPFGQFNKGDVSSNGVPTTSRGPFQQKQEWGPIVDRLDPNKSAKMFFTGGQAGQKGLLDVAGWQNMAPEMAAEAVQGSRQGGANFARNLAQGTAVADSITCVAGAAGSVVANGVSVTLPNNQFVAEAVRGKTVTAPNAGIAKGLAAGLSHLGKPYVWGGGGDGEGPNNGCARGGGQLNSCGSEIGFDCSGLTAYVLVQGGFPSPGGNSGAQRGGGTSVAYAAGLAGDIVGFPGHVALFLGVIDGTQYILEASTVGVPVHVVALTRSDRDPMLHRYWSQGAVS